MQIYDDTKPKPAPPPPAKPTTPQPPWRAEPRPYGGVYGMPAFMRLTKIMPDGTAGELLVEGTDEAKLWGYIEHLEQENRRLKLELELAPLTQREMPAELAERLSAPPTKPNIPDAGGFADLTGATQNDAPSNSPEITAVAEEPPAAEGIQPSLREQAESELLRDCSRSNVKIGEALGCSHELVRQVRKQLESEGRLQRREVSTSTPETVTSAPTG